MRPRLNQDIVSGNSSHPSTGEAKKMRWLTLLLCSLLASCATWDVHPASGFDANPPAEAIVGMWATAVHLDGKKYTLSLLLNTDGTGLSRGTGTGEYSSPAAWKYDGSGWWTVSDQFDNQNRVMRFRITPEPPAGGSRSLFLVSNSASPGYISRKFARIE